GIAFGGHTHPLPRAVTAHPGNRSSAGGTFLEGLIRSWRQRCAEGVEVALEQGVPASEEDDIAVCVADAAADLDDDDTAAGQGEADVEAGLGGGAVREVIEGVVGAVSVEGDAVGAERAV